MNVRVLLVESEPQDALFLRDVLVEIESGRYWNKWVHIETLHASSWTEASLILANEPIDLILLDPDLSDSHGVATFRRVQAVAEHIPLVLLLGPEDTAMGVRMVREGAQDFLIKRQIDCAPLAHAMHNAMERHRLISAARAASATDSLTGLPNRGGFLTFADRDRKLAERLGRRLMIVVAEPRSLDEVASAFGEQRRDLALVETADHLRSLAGPTDLVGRIGAGRFGMAIFETDVETLEEAWARIHTAGESHRIRIGAAIFNVDRPVSLDVLLNQAAGDLAPNAMAMPG
ncbi:MAG TPA: diguanylate cyclase [Bryobacteraceae bacterium]|nr:diguanylate cyclase [Bryobacteraceae bacterium]